MMRLLLAVVLCSTAAAQLGTLRLRSALTGGAAGPSLTASPSTLSFFCAVGSADPPSQIIAIGGRNVTLDNWSATKTLASTTLAPTSNTVASNLTVAVSCSGLTIGSYPDVVTVASTTAGITAPITVPVSLIVSAPARPSPMGGKVGANGKVVIH